MVSTTRSARSIRGAPALPSLGRVRSALQVFGGILVVVGISGTLDRLLVQPFFGPFLNVVNRYVIPRVHVLTDHALVVNLGVVVLGGLLVVGAASRVRSR